MLHNEGPLYVGADPFMGGTSMFLDELKVRPAPLGLTAPHSSLALQQSVHEAAPAPGAQACAVGARRDC